jgi:hypothetical protein
VNGIFGHWLARFQQHQDANVGLPPIKIVHFDVTLSLSSTRRRIASHANDITSAFTDRFF